MNTSSSSSASGTLAKSSIPSGHYTIDPTHSQLGFAARHAMVTKVHGIFTEYTGTGTFDSETPSNSSIEVIIQAKSIDTRNSDRDAHLRSNDFFDMENNPTITFVSTDISTLNTEDLLITGDLTIKGTTKRISIPFTFTGSATDPYGNVRIGLEGRTEVNRKDWNITWNAPLEAGGILVSDKINLEFEISAIRTPDGTPNS